MYNLFIHYRFRYYPCNFPYVIDAEIGTHVRNGLKYPKVATYDFLLNIIVGEVTNKTSILHSTDPEVRVRFPALPNFVRCSGSGTGFTQPREYN
jgi:hypothetical protein